ncbi:hypothetical protein Sez_0607 [Streptococcus equi subsp. zooepidemicus MGCS10565]|uniref:Uncharacterized protein n=1 Tax=Streptococcus equi subsp. zooepidemicus (strain MGCS10565) TaxID=552526 RepID=B4U1V7_STREM|nr:hypothetical protein Sez_0607 [Streptococcus equi subsp. zooepidemicus MGCS10565]AEJ24826.1 conserved hypothetical protein [Streptococcus equi subsp. zooepidemicus ATCC 35246]
MMTWACWEAGPTEDKLVILLVCFYYPLKPSFSYTLSSCRACG